MDKFVTKRNDLLAEQVIKNLKSRQMEGHYVQTKEEALALALELIPEGSSISWGGSMSIKAIGLPEEIHAKASLEKVGLWKSVLGSRSIR